MWEGATSRTVDLINACAMIILRRLVLLSLCEYSFNALLSLFLVNYLHLVGQDAINRTTLDNNLYRFVDSLTSGIEL